MKKRNYGIILVLILLIGVGYAYLSTTLTINGTANFKRNGWSIIWDKDTIRVLGDSVTITQEETLEANGGFFGARLVNQDTANEDPTTIEYKAPLRLPGDIYHFTVDMKNAGTIDAMITENGVRKLITTLNDDELKYITYWVRYTDGNEIKPGDGLKAGQSRNVEVFIKYRDDVDPDDLPNQDNPRVLRSEFDFVQADNTANYTRVSLSNDPNKAPAGVAGEGATQVKAVAVDGNVILPNAKFTALTGTYTVTVTYVNNGSNAAKFKGITKTGVNADVDVAITDSEGTALVVNDTTIAASGELTVKYVFSVKSGAEIPAGGLLINATDAVASVQANFTE